MIYPHAHFQTWETQAKSIYSFPENTGILQIKLVFSTLMQFSTLKYLVHFVSVHSHVFSAL